MNLLLMTSHSIAEYDDLRMLTDLGYNVFSIGAYTDPRNPTDDKRPALGAPFYADLAARCDEVRAVNGEPGPYIDFAKARLHPDIIEWADAIIVHHFPDRWIGGQWDRIKHKRVIWRTCGQSGADGSLERFMAQFDGLEIVRYSPKERCLPDYAGEDALIRFGKYPADYGPWTGDKVAVGNVTQHMAQRGDACGYGFWLAATDGLPTMPAGPGSELLRGGVGALSYEAMLDYLRTLRVYLYTGTRPASYTLGLIEAMLSGVPVVPIGAREWGKGWGGEGLFEAHEIIPPSDAGSVGWARTILTGVLSGEFGHGASEWQRQAAIDLFDVATVGPQWKAFLG